MSTGAHTHARGPGGHKLLHIQIGTRNLRGHMEPGRAQAPVCGSKLPGEGHTCRHTLRTASSVKQLFPAGDPLPQSRRRVLGEGLVRG